MEVKTSTWRPGSAVCRCCLAEGCYKDISTEYFWMGKREVYAEMLTETFDLSISYSQSGGPNSNSRLICEPCISRLRDASEFKRQVYDCEKMFMQHLEPTGSSSGSTSLQVEIEPQQEDKGVKVEVVKEEKDDSGDDFFDDRNDFADDDDDDLDDEPLTNLATKVPKKEKEVDLLDFLDKPTTKKTAEKRKAAAPAKTKATPIKKAKLVKEAKPSASKDKVVEKKKKGICSGPPSTENSRDIRPSRRAARGVDENVRSAEDMALEHSGLLLRHSTLYPFKLDCKQMIQCLVCSNVKKKSTFNNPNDFRTHFEEKHSGVDTSHILQAISPHSVSPRVDITELRCRLCDDGVIFDSINTVALHLNQRHDVKVNAELAPLVPIRLEVDKFLCVLCEKVTATLLHLYSHSGKHFSRYICDHCDKNFETRNTLKNHLNNHHSESGVQCKRCKKVLPTKKALNDHIKASEICFPAGCSICGKRFLSNRFRQLHLIRVHNKPKTVYPCKECDQIFNDSNSRYLHFKAAHTDEFKCELCSKKYTHKRAYMEHMNRHAGILPFSCTLCTRAFPSEHRLKQHMREHDPMRNFHCATLQAKAEFPAECSYKTTNKGLLQMHVSRMHPEIYEQNFGNDLTKKHCCSVCAYTAQKGYRLKLHVMRMHPDIFEKEFENDTKMFYCSACAYKNRQKDRLKTHVERKHPDIFSHEFPIDASKMKQCSACPYKNRLRCKLKVHVKRRHPEIYEQEFGNAQSRFNYCNACSYKIRGERSLLRLHVKKEHPALFAKEFKPRERKIRVCPACPFKNVNRYCLMTHVKKWHPEVYKREFESDVIAREKKMMQCPACSYQHHQNCRLKAHVKRKHPELLTEGDIEFQEASS